MVRLSALITEKRGQQEKLEQGNIIMENDFIHALKVLKIDDHSLRQYVWLLHPLQDAELESIQLQSKVDQLKEEKERILNSLVESEWA